LINKVQQPSLPNSILCYIGKIEEIFENTQQNLEAKAQTAKGYRE
jgi:hypothetical protein